MVGVKSELLARNTLRVWLSDQPVAEPDGTNAYCTARTPSDVPPVLSESLSWSQETTKLLAPSQATAGARAPPTVNSSISTLPCVSKIEKFKKRRRVPWSRKFSSLVLFHATTTLPSSLAATYGSKLISVVSVLTWNWSPTATPNRSNWRAWTLLK